MPEFKLLHWMTAFIQNPPDPLQTKRTITTQSYLLLSSFFCSLPVSVLYATAHNSFCFTQMQMLWEVARTEKSSNPFNHETVRCLFLGGGRWQLFVVWVHWSLHAVFWEMFGSEVETNWIKLNHVLRCGPLKPVRSASHLFSASVLRAASGEKIRRVHL